MNIFASERAVQPEVAPRPAIDRETGAAPRRRQTLTISPVGDIPATFAAKLIKNQKTPLWYIGLVRFQKRDGKVIQSIYERDGLLARRHLKEMFWPNATLRAAQKRLSKLVENGYLCRPTPQQRRTQPLPEQVFFVGYRGILWIAGQTGVNVDSPTNHGENQMRTLARRLRAQGIRWLREPRWQQCAHDLAVVDFRLAIEQEVVGMRHCSLETWVHESAFRCDADIVTYQAKDRDGRVRQKKKRVYPDSYFALQRLVQGIPTRARFLLELDNASHPNERFGWEKILPGLAYLKSSQYRARFGDNSGRWLIVTTGKTRMKNLMRQTLHMAGTASGVFLFTTLDQIGTCNILTRPVWWRAGHRKPIPLLAGETDAEH